MPRARKRRQLTDVTSLPRLREALRTSALIPVQNPTSFRTTPGSKARLGPTRGVTVGQIASLAARIIGTPEPDITIPSGLTALPRIGESPTGAVNGVNAHYELIMPQASDTVAVWVDGGLLLPAASAAPVAGEYVKTGNSIDLAIPPQQFIECDYSSLAASGPGGYISAFPLARVGAPPSRIYDFPWTPDQTKVVAIYNGNNRMIETAAATPGLAEYEFLAGAQIEVGLDIVDAAVTASFYAAIEAARLLEDVQEGSGPGITSVTLTKAIFENNISAWLFYPNAFGYRLHRVAGVPASGQYQIETATRIGLGDAVFTGTFVVVEHLSVA